MTVLFLIIVPLVLATAIFLVYMGLFRPVTVTERDQGPFTFVYREMTGTGMKKVGGITASLNTLLTEMGVDRRKPLQVYYPDGRAEIGLAVDGARPDQLAALGEKAKVREVPVRHCMLANFPLRNTLSFVAGYFKVDPAFAKHRAMRGYRKVEAMTLLNGPTIFYMQPIVLEKISPP